MKRLLPDLLTLLLCMYPCVASLADADEAADGYLTSGEYYGGAIRLEGTDKLIVNGGGANWVEAWGSSRLEIYSTSLPLSLNPGGGVYDILLHDNSTMLFSGGATQSIVVKSNATALLTGGTINYVTIYHRPQDSCLVTIDCKKDWEWLYTSSKITGIRGLWHDGTPFQITLSNVGSPWPDTAQYVNVIPEPATLLLVGLGGLMIRRKTL